MLKLGEIISAGKADADRVQAKHKYVINISVPARLKNIEVVFQYFQLEKAYFKASTNQ